MTNDSPSRLVHRGWLNIIFATFFVVFFCASFTNADTPRNDIEINLGIEIGNGNEDFADENETVEKGRFVKYQIDIKNKGGKTYNDLTLLMDAPDYMDYISGSVYKRNPGVEDGSLITDFEGGISPLEVGYDITSLAPGGQTFFIIQFQVKKEIPADEVYSLVIANIVSQYGSIPVVSNPIETRISGEPKSSIQVIVKPYPAAGEGVNSGFYITYDYTLHNVGGEKEEGVKFTTHLPANTTCILNCGVHEIDTMESNETRNIVMQVEVNSGIEGVSAITNIGYDLYGNTMVAIENRDAIVHPIDVNAMPQEGDFRVDIVQEPNIVLNSSNGYAREDDADRSKTKYTFSYTGRKRSNTYPALDRSGTDFFPGRRNKCQRAYPYKWGATTYAYNSGGSPIPGDCEVRGGCPLTLVSTPVVFNIETKLPNNAPEFRFTENSKASTQTRGATGDSAKQTTIHEHGNPYTVNSYMKNGSTFIVPEPLTEIRAVENGGAGIVTTEVSAVVSEDKWQYVNTYNEECTYYYLCGESTCFAKVNVPHYSWQRTSVNIYLPSVSGAKALAQTNIDVYTSTAWLKTEKGHIGTNDQLTNRDTPANHVDLGMTPFRDHLTPSYLYTPPNEFNAEYMVFGKNGTGSMKTSCGEDGAGNCDDWTVTGTEFKFLQKGEAYDRDVNPRNYYDDMLDRQMYGEVKKNELSSNLNGTVELGDDIVWHNDGDITIGKLGLPDEVVFAGGQARIYTDGDVYINANIRYGTSQAGNYNSITSVRIDARNIYVSGEVEDLQVMLLARNSFKSGKSKKQLRILGDVIAGQSHWEREPLLEFSPDEFNKPSEHIIEDMRKYVVPVPGDTQVPDDYSVWRQVNPSTGETLDGW